MDNDVIEQLDSCIKWLDDNNKSNNLIAITQVIDRIAVLSVNVGHMVSEAYDLSNKLEDEFKFTFAKAVAESELSVAKAEKAAEVAAYQTSPVCSQDMISEAVCGMLAERRGVAAP